jgi:hypothetical protein
LTFKCKQLSNAGFACQPMGLSSMSGRGICHIVERSDGLPLQGNLVMRLSASAIALIVGLLFNPGAKLNCLSAG